MELTTVERVDAGVAWLNENGPADWVDRIDTSTLDTSDGDVCVLGQAFAPEASVLSTNGYCYALDTWPELFDEAWELGFSGMDPLEYNTLTFHWKLSLDLLKMEMAA